MSDGVGVDGCGRVECCSKAVCYPYCIRSMTGSQSTDGFSQKDTNKMLDDGRRGRWSRGEASGFQVLVEYQITTSFTTDGLLYGGLPETSGDDMVVVYYYLLRTVSRENL